MPDVQPAQREATALPAQQCVGCGGHARWDAARQVLACAYCGTSWPTDTAADGTVVKEHDAVAVLRAIPEDQRGWAEHRVAVRCQSCQAISLFEPERVAQRCDFCGSATVLPAGEAVRPIRPDGLLPFSVVESEARELACRSVGRGAAAMSATGVYVPFWRLTCDVYVHWFALVEAGHSNNLGGTADGGFSDLDDTTVMPASRALPEALLRDLEPFPMDQVKPYDPDFVAGWIVEQYQIDLVAAGDRATAALAEAAPSKYRRWCRAEVPTRHYSGLTVSATASLTAFRHLLLPVWTVQVAKGPDTRRVVINGATGKVAGDGKSASGRIGWLVAAIVLGLAWFIWTRL